MFSSKEDIHRRFIIQELLEDNNIVQTHVRNMIKFLNWRTENACNALADTDYEIIRSRNTLNISGISHNACKYSKKLMDTYTEYLWQENIENKLLTEGWSQFPKVCCLPLPIPFGVSRESEVLVMSLFYTNNLLNSFLFRLNKERWVSPLCKCGAEQQDALHLLTQCQLVGEERLNSLWELMCVCNNTKSNEDPTGNPYAIINCSRDPQFIKLCLEIVEIKELQLRTKINLKKSSA